MLVLTRYASELDASWSPPLDTDCIVLVTNHKGICLIYIASYPQNFFVFVVLLNW